MDNALEEAYEGIKNHHGGPFGAVVVKDGKIIGKGHNKVILNNDPTCHGEIEAIRDACKNTGSYDLSGAEIYTTAEPCPMCMGAILWANIKKVYSGCNRTDTAKIGFRDDKFYRLFESANKDIQSEGFEIEKCKKLFDDYAKTNAVIY